MRHPDEPRLAPPGAGLPWAELAIGRMIFAVQRRIITSAGFSARFRREQTLIRGLIQSLDPETGARRVLIPRLPGLEDSSRYWSAWMTLDHLRIVHGSISGVIAALSLGRIPAGTASTAAVKPDAQAHSAVVPAFERSCEDLVSTVAKAGELKTPVRYAHPWFGPLDAAGWHAMAAVHLGIHRRQLQRICALSGVGS